MSQTPSHHNLITLCHSGTLAIQTLCSPPSLHHSHHHVHTNVNAIHHVTQRSTVTSVILFHHCLCRVLTSLALLLSLPLSIFHYTPPLLIICLSTYPLLCVLCYGSPCSPLVYKYFVLHCILYLIINYKSVFPLREVVLSINC
jgi:hypothetical protein